MTGTLTASLTELHRETAKVVRPATHGTETVVLTEHGKIVAEIRPRRPVDRVAARKALMALGPIDLPPRK